MRGNPWAFAGKLAETALIVILSVFLFTVASEPLLGIPIWVVPTLLLAFLAVIWLPPAGPQRPR